MKTLGGITFVRNGIEYDYNFRETIDCLLAFCDKVVVLDAGSTDGTDKEIARYANANGKVSVVCLDSSLWDSFKGREKLAYFQNLALSILDTDYYFLLQADEVLHEDCFQSVRDAIETGGDTFYCNRINLWKDAQHQLNVPHERLPCNTYIIRLAKTNYLSIGDGESIEAKNPIDYSDEIDIWHYGFVRKKEVMKDKIINMQENVFQMPRDAKLNNMEVFDWSAWFKDSDLIEVEKEHPIFIQKWIKNRP